MSAIRIYESALSCDTGVCGPDVDQSPADVTADVRHLQGLLAELGLTEKKSDGCCGGSAS